MSKELFDSQVLRILFGLMQEAKQMNVKRVNSSMLFRALLVADESPLYKALLLQMNEKNYFPFADLIDETYGYDPESEETDEESEEETEFPSICMAYESSEGKVSGRLYFDDDLKEVFHLIIEYLKEDLLITVEDLTAFLVIAMPFDIIKILREFGFDIHSLKVLFSERALQKIKEERDKQSNLKHFESKKENSVNKGENSESKAGISGLPIQNNRIKKVLQIPSEFKGFVKNLNELFEGTVCDISGREKECEFIWQTMQKQTKKNVVLIGEPGVGKTSVVQKITHDIITGNCPEEFKNSTVLSIDVTSSVAGTSYRGQAEERYSKFAEFLEKRQDIIVFIDEIHLIKGAGACREGEIDLANALKPILAGNNVRIIGATTTEEYEKYFSQDGAIKRRFRPIKIKEPKMNEVYPMLKKSIETLSKYHGVTISKAMVDFIILNAACFHNETRNPDRTKDLIDLSMVVAKQAGKTKVDRQSVLTNFEYHLDKFAKMSEAIKRSTAYHEAGHCLVMKCAKSLANHSVIAVSIMPTDTYMGVTVFEQTEITVEPTMQYFIDSIACDLAGRVAEKMYNSTISSGASVDLANATKTAHNLITRYGMAEFGMNRIYTRETTSEEVKNLINKEIDQLIEKGIQRAEEILRSNLSSLILLVEALMKNGIVGTNELNQILKDVKLI